MTDVPTAEPLDATAPEEPPARRPRWWPIGVGVAVALVVVWAFATAWVGIWGSSPAYLITLLLSLALTIALVVSALVLLKPLSAEPIAIGALDDGIDRWVVHSFFGDYGLQRGDGTPTISRTDARDQIAAAPIRLLETLGS